MITRDFAATMTRYNQWQNRSLITAADTLTDADRWKDRGAFFRSIAETLNHILWDDRLWLARFRRDDKAVSRINAQHPYTNTPVDWPAYMDQRNTLDEEIVVWADLLTSEDLSSMITWRRGAERVQTTLGFNLVHLINHQTHHRGQVHAMLTQAGARMGSTDLQMLNAG